MSVGPLLSELAVSTNNSLFEKIGTGMLYLLMAIGSLVAIIGSIKLWNNRYKDED